MAAQSFTLFTNLPGEIQKRIWNFVEGNVPEIAENELEGLLGQDFLHEHDRYTGNSGFLETICRQLPAIRNSLATFPRATLIAISKVVQDVEIEFTGAMNVETYDQLGRAQGYFLECLGADILRAKEWDVRVQSYGGVDKAVPEILEPWELEDVVTEFEECFNPHATYYIIFMRLVVREGYHGGGLEEGAANRVLTLKKWREVIFRMKVGEKNGKIREVVRSVLEGLDEEIAREWGKRNGLRLL